MCGGHGWGGPRGGFGLFFPALLVGRLIAEAVDQGQRQPAAPAGTLPPLAPGARAAPGQPGAAVVAGVCPACRAALEPGFRFCPHCGHKLAPAACRYCGQALAPGGRYCAACGAPQGA